MFLVDFHFTNIEDLTNDLTMAHRQHLADAYKSDDLVFGGPKSPRTGGIVISRHKERHHLENLLATDPIVLAGLAAYTITEFNVALAAKEFESLSA